MGAGFDAAGVGTEGGRLHAERKLRNFPANNLLMACAMLCMQVMNPEPCLERRRPVRRGWVDVGR